MHRYVINIPTAVGRRDLIRLVKIIHGPALTCGISEFLFLDLFSCDWLLYGVLDYLLNDFKSVY